MKLTNGISCKQSSHAVPNTAEILEAGILARYAPYLICKALPAGVQALKGLSGRGKQISNPEAHSNCRTSAACQHG